MPKIGIYRLTLMHHENNQYRYTHLYEGISVKWYPILTTCKLTRFNQYKIWVQTSTSDQRTCILKNL